MKLTETKLRQIIREEIQRLSETVTLSSNTKKFWNTPISKITKVYSTDLPYTIPPSQWNTNSDIINGYGRNAGPDLFSGVMTDLSDSSGNIDSKLSKIFGIHNLNDLKNGSGLNNDKNFKRYGSINSALYDIYEEMKNKYGERK